MAESEYPQLLFEQHDPNKFYKYEEIQNHQGFRLPDEKNNNIYLLDQDGGWCDLNGCYYDSQGQPSGWIALSKDGKKYMKFNMNSDLLIESSNIYYSNDTFDAAHSEQYQQLYQSNNKKQLNENQQPKIQSSEQQDQTNKNEQQKLKGYKDKQEEAENQNQKMKNAPEKVKDQQQTINQLQTDQKVGKMENEIKQFRNKSYREKNNKKKSKKDDQNKNNNETQKYYSLDIKENTLSKEDFVKQLIEVYKIKKDCIIEFNEKILKLVSEKDAIKLYRANKKEQTDKVQKFIVSI